MRRAIERATPYPCCATLRIRIFRSSMMIRLRNSASSGTELKRQSNASSIVRWWLVKPST